MKRWSVCLLAALSFSPAPLHAVQAAVPFREVVTGLSFPVAMAVAPGGTLLITEKAGNVRAVRQGVLDPAPIARFEPHTNNEAGVLGITVVPEFATTSEFLVLYTPLADLNHIRIARLRLAPSGPAEVLADPWLELPSRPTDRHYSGNMRFGPDGKLYITLGELRRAEWAQDPNLPGSILRYNADGSVPTDNPFSTTSSVYAMGIRNSYDLTIARDGRIYASENGGDINDEVNYIEAGKNYGWPLVQGYCDHLPTHEPCQLDDAYVDPIVEFRQVIGATGITVYEGDLFPTWKGDLFVGGFHSKVVHRLQRSAAVGRWLELAPIFDLGLHDEGYFGGGVVDVEVDEDGSVLVLAGGLELGSVYRLTPEPEPTDASQSRSASRESGESGCSFARTSAPSSAFGMALLLGLCFAYGARAARSSAPRDPLQRGSAEPMTSAKGCSGDMATPFQLGFARFISSK